LCVVWQDYSYDFCLINTLFELRLDPACSLENGQMTGYRDKKCIGNLTDTAGKGLFPHNFNKLLLGIQPAKSFFVIYIVNNVFRRYFYR
jgi:hypothetical protein